MPPTWCSDARRVRVILENDGRGVAYESFTNMANNHKTDHNRHKQITEIVAMYSIRRKTGGNSWANKLSLQQICAALDERHIPIPSNWRSGRTKRLSKIGLHLNGWSDGLELGYKMLVINRIQYSTKRQRLIDAAAEATGQ